MSQACLFTREPVVNKKRAITANRIIAHAPSIGAVIEALGKLPDAWPHHHPLFISLARLVPTPELLNWDWPDNVIIEIPVQALAHPQTQALIAALDDNGRPANLTWVTADTQIPGAIDWRFSLIDARRQPAPPAAAPGLKLAWGLANSAAFAAAVERGFDGASGWFFLRDQASSTQELAPNHAQIIRILNLARNDGEVRDIEVILKQDVALSYKLLRYINSAGFGLMCEIQSFRHAVSILGYNALNKWLSLLLVSASRDPSAPALMQTAIARGRFMEEIGKNFFSASETDNLFITGAFSLLPQLIGASMSAVLDEMNLPASVSDALLGSEGEYAPFLQLARLCESFDGKALQEAAAGLHLPVEQLNDALFTALSFADSLQS